ncbi:hypothetical protein [Christiangramia forsetii]|uniref:Secreted protein n=2 Tax=Christiangramia forsetii TaxID=411153 RepID=A0LYJ6_CHRFK|nr:hypothetical protein [Christiangramia forsetii]GGG34025.1 hypothetical protein GCM10011532_17130 [Christiangramia forsetii]CAL65441.1 secreted protein [Christiangramia forsetii KT0803]
MITKTKILFAIVLCSAAFISCEPEALPEQEIITKVSDDIDPVGTGNEQNDEEHRGED